MVDHLNLVLSNIPRIDRKDVLVMGDFNVNMKGEKPDKNKLTRFGYTNRLEQLITKPTRCTATAANVIDLRIDKGSQCVHRRT